MSRTLAILLLSAVAAAAQSGLLPPQVGFVRDSTGSVRPVVGIRANFMLGDPLLDNVRSAAFSGRSGLVKTDQEIIVFDTEGRILGRQPAPPGEALFAFAGDGLPALAYLVETKELYRQRGAGLTPVPWSPLRVDGEVLALASLRGGLIALVIRGEDALWLSWLVAESGEVRFEALLPGVSAPVLPRPDGSLLYADGNEVVIRASDATERRVPLPLRAAGFQQMGEGWIHVLAETGGAGLALRLAADGEYLHRLPGGRQ